MQTANDVYGPRARTIPASQGALWAPTLYWTVPGPKPDLAHLLPAGPGTDLLVYANQGRWVVSCPDCNGSQLACPTDPRFICSDCGNVSVEGRWRRTVWPPNRARIEALLDIRPLPNRNWLPNESEERLEEENVRHGVTVPAPPVVEPVPWEPESVGD